MCLQHIHVCPICADYIVPVPRCEAAEDADRGTAPPLALPAPPRPPPAAPSPPSLNNGGGSGHSGSHHHYHRHDRHGSSFSDSDETAVDSDTNSFSSSASGRPARFSTASGEQARQRWAGLVTRIGCPAFESRNKAAFALCDGCKADMAALFGGGGGAAGSVRPHEFPMGRADGYVVWGLIKAE